MNAQTEFERAAGGKLRARGIEVVQANVGLVCNQSCSHCHQKAGPGRREIMSPEVMAGVTALAGALRPRYVDITGGAPELAPRLKDFIVALGDAGHAVTVRTNLTVLTTAACADFPEFYAARGVKLVASLPCYLEENVDAMRGPGAYAASIEALIRLNALGYGRAPGLKLDLVYNPLAAALPPGQKALEADYRRELAARWGIAFNNLLCLANVPLGRFLDGLRRTGEEAAYRRLLRESFNPGALANLMCLTQVIVGHDGRIYDCDFNLALNLPVNHGAPANVLAPGLDALATREVVTGAHCFACSAGQGSSCAGALCGA
ncbi:MAG: arsenosugar biosynthesis radical SAM protein ArsS [Desulfovibrionaceae bacterium]|nr:arsenosugar biosynthesis radical SAM protein ArsS [Desulfovibrionaceae bacterium]MBF0514144.1 arsenosugar biosynthesis radical SAM protein ArsS [Desulfovibrionaceae bacterium]